MTARPLQKQPLNLSNERTKASLFGALECGFTAWPAPDLLVKTEAQATVNPSAFARLWRVFMTARVAIASVLLILEAFMRVLGPATSHWTVTICIAYLLAAVAVRLWAKPVPPASAFDLQWLLIIGVDVMVFFVLNLLQSGGISYTPLFALPVLLSSVLGPVLLALGTAASVTLLLLGDAWWNSLLLQNDNKARYLQAALSGSGFFLVALLANQLALRLAGEEKLAYRNRLAARMQSQINHLVVETLADGVLVADIEGRVYSANPAARRLLLTGNNEEEETDPAREKSDFNLTESDHLQPLAMLVKRCFASQLPERDEICLPEPGLSSAHQRLHVRARLAISRDVQQHSLCVVFLEDLREMEARVRTEKMAAMGRMSAAVAHEIRNPLAAITQANALLEEDIQDPAQRQLLTIVQQNAKRLAKIVDDVLNIARVHGQKQSESVPAAALRISLDDTAARIVLDWQAQNNQSPALLVALKTAPAQVVFEADHLRRLIVNLLDNALRYASGVRHSIEIHSCFMETGQMQLAVWSDGLALERSVQAHLFEPFFSSESRSSGLGLYICRQLCERHGASIAYERVNFANRPYNAFTVTFA